MLVKTTEFQISCDLAHMHERKNNANIVRCQRRMIKASQHVKHEDTIHKKYTEESD